MHDVGALDVLEGKGILRDIERAGGTSAGAITALLVGLRYTTFEIQEILSGLDFQRFLDDSWGVVRDSKRLLQDFGWYRGDFFRRWIAELVARRTGNGEATFEEVRERGEFLDLYFVGTNLSTRFAEVFSFEHTPRMPVADAVRISMSIPLFFRARRSPRGDVFVDGGLLDNYPVKLFDREKYVSATTGARRTEYYEAHNAELERRGEELEPYVYNKETLGFRLDAAQEIVVFRDQTEPARHKIDDLFSYTWALVQTILAAQDSRHLHDDDWQRTIYIDTLGVGTTDFDLDAGRKAALVESGRKGCERYFEWFDDPAQAPVNR